MRLIAKNLSIDRNGRRLIENLSFSLESGEALSIQGLNGAGKSSLLRALAGLLTLRSGGVICEGYEEANLAMHYVGHSDGLKSALTAMENLSFWANFLSDGQGGPHGGEQTPQAALAVFGLSHITRFPVAYLSAGQRRRVALARLLIAPRPIWLLDEPTTALDASAQTILAEVMQRHRAGGGMILAATHSALALEGAHTLYLGAAAPYSSP